MTFEQTRYRDAHLHTDLHYNPIQGLAVHWGYKCLHCTSFCCKDQGACILHLIKRHGFLENQAVNEMLAQSRIPIQSLGQGRKELFFPVHFPSVAEISSLREPNKDDTQVGQDTLERNREPHSNALPTRKSQNPPAMTERNANGGMRSPFKTVCQKSLPGSVDCRSHAKQLSRHAPHGVFRNQHELLEGAQKLFETPDGDMDPCGTLLPEQPQKELNTITTDMDLIEKSNNLSTFEGIQTFEVVDCGNEENHSHDENVFDKDVEGFDEQILTKTAESEGEGERPLNADSDSDPVLIPNPNPNLNPNPNPNPIPNPIPIPSPNPNCHTDPNANNNRCQNLHGNAEDHRENYNADDHREKEGDHLTEAGICAKGAAQAENCAHSARETVNVAIEGSNLAVPHSPLRGSSIRRKNDADPNLENTENTTSRSAPLVHASDVQVVADINSFNIALERMHDSLTSSAPVQNDHENDYYDVSLNELPGDMDKNDSTMLKRCGFPGTLIRMGFLTLGSVPTVLCFTANRMARLVKAHTDIPHPCKSYSQRPNGGPQLPEIGKANKPVVAALMASLDTSCERTKRMKIPDESFLLPPATNEAALQLADLEEQIQKNVQSYLQSASKVTTSAPNFVRSLVNAHNGVFAGIPSSRRTARRLATSNNEDSAWARRDLTERQGEECGQTHYISSVDFFRVLSSKKGITNYSRRVSQLVLAAVRSFLAQSYADSFSKYSGKPLRNDADLEALEAIRDRGDGDRPTRWQEQQKQDEQDLLNNCQKSTPDLIRSLGAFTESDLLHESAVKTCLCSVGYCFHSPKLFRNSASVEGIEDDHHHKSDQQHQNEEEEADGESNDAVLDGEKNTDSHNFISPCFSQRHKWTSSNKHTVKDSTGVIHPKPIASHTHSLVSEFSPGEIGIHWLLRALLLHECTSRNTTDGIFLSRFLAVTSVDDRANIVSKRKFHEAHEIAPYPSAVAYAMKCCGVVEMRRNLADWTSSALCPQKKQFIQRDLKSQADRNWLLTHQQISRCFSVSHNTPASYLYGISGALKASARANEDVLVRFVECAKPGPQHKHCALVHGKECSIQDFGLAVQNWQSKAEAILSTELMLEMELPDGFQNVTELLHDDLQESARGHWFLKNPGNSAINGTSSAFKVVTHPNNCAFTEKTSTKALLSQWSQAVFKHIYNNQNLRAQFFGTSPTVHRSNAAAARQSGIQSLHPTHIKGLAMRPERLNKYLDACQKLKRYLLSLLHVTGGGPARSTEMGYLLKNSATSRRNVFLLQGELMFLARYNKRDAMKKSGGSAIARFPDKRTSEIFFKYFILVRTLEELFVYTLHGPEIAKQHETTLFATSTTGKPYSDLKLRDEIVQCFQEDGIPFTFQEFRH